MDKNIRIHPRKLARQMAKAQLDRQKVTGYNKETVSRDGYKIPSVFARNWRKLAQEAASTVYPRKKAAR